MTLQLIGENVLLIAKSIAVLGGLVLLLAAILIQANRKLHVATDPRIDLVEDMLPHTNCGACGFAGCRAFAEALVSKETVPAKCTVSSEAGHEKIANFLGVAVGETEKVVARLACAGGTNVAYNQARYSGLPTCRAAALVSGGGKSCSWGCLGLADCMAVCDFDAIYMNSHSLPVVIEEKCTACGDCVEICPKDLFSLHPADHRLWVACKSLAAGDEVLEECQVACTACAKCAFDAKDGLIEMVNNLPVINYEKDHHTRHPIERCPTGSIIWLDESGEMIKGKASKAVIRKDPLPAKSS